MKIYIEKWKNVKIQIVGFFWLKRTDWINFLGGITSTTKIIGFIILGAERTNKGLRSSPPPPPGGEVRGVPSASRKTLVEMHTNPVMLQSVTIS